MPIHTPACRSGKTVRASSNTSASRSDHTHCPTRSLGPAARTLIVHAKTARVGIAVPSMTQHGHCPLTEVSLTSMTRARLFDEGWATPAVGVALAPGTMAILVYGRVYWCSDLQS